MARLYHQDPYLRQAESVIESAFEEDGKYYVAVDEGIFYPQGGGQKGDHGLIRVNGHELVVLDTIKDQYSNDGRPICVVNVIEDIAKGDVATMELDWDRRYKQMRLHSVVHLHHCLMEKIAGRSLRTPSTSDLSDDGTAYNRYESDEITEELSKGAMLELAALVAAGAPVETKADPKNEDFRYWESLGFVIPCGGTHLADLAEIGDVVAVFSKKKGKPKVAFQLVS